MKRTFAMAAAVVLALGAGGCATMHEASSGGWVSLFDGRSLDAFERVGDANWRIDAGSVVADKGSGFLVTKNTYNDFEIRAEFWADADANSGIFIRCQDRVKLNSDVCYEVNIYDKRPDPVYGTGAIVDVAKVVPMPKAAGKWNTYEITAKGNRLVVKLNGMQTADVQNGKHARGPIGLQYAPGVVKDSGTIKFRKVEIRAL
jgi:hypothetical protein